jgi:hypothetical protein
LQSGHIGRRYLEAGIGHLAVTNVEGMTVELFVSVGTSQIREDRRLDVHLEVRHALRTSALLFPFPGPVHSGAGAAGMSRRFRDDPATGPFWFEGNVSFV